MSARIKFRLNRRTLEVEFAPALAVRVEVRVQGVGSVLPLPANPNHRPPPRHPMRLHQLLRRRVSRLLGPEAALDELSQLGVARSRSQRRAQVKLPLVE